MIEILLIKTCYALNSINLLKSALLNIFLQDLLIDVKLTFCCEGWLLEYKLVITSLYKKKLFCTIEV